MIIIIIIISLINSTEIYRILCFMAPTPVVTAANPVTASCYIRIRRKINEQTMKKKKKKRSYIRNSVFFNHWQHAKRVPKTLLKFETTDIQKLRLQSISTNCVQTKMSFGLLNLSFVEEVREQYLEKQRNLDDSHKKQILTNFYVFNKLQTAIYDCSKK